MIDSKTSVAGAVVKSGPKGIAMNFAYNNRQGGGSAVFEDLGEMLIDLCGKVPNGILVCFSSGSLMKLAQDCWITSPKQFLTRFYRVTDWQITHSHASQ